MAKRNKSWVDIPSGSDFSLQNLPYGIFSTPKRSKRAGIALGNQIIDLYALAQLGYLDDLNVPKTDFRNDYLNDFISRGRPVWRQLREILLDLFSVGNSKIKSHASKILVSQSDAVMHLPVKVGDYTDFYSSKEHATNVGKMFRDPKNALLPNWRHIPVGYHGRASSIYISGTPVFRPMGQRMPKGGKRPVFGPSVRMDFELEMGTIIGGQTSQGKRVSTRNAEQYIFGLVLFNDWSARDIQKWEYVPLGPFLGKSFASTISPWIVTLDALAPFRVDGPKQTPKVLPYLESKGKKNFNINLEVGLTPKDGMENIICRSNFKYMYWNMSQQVAHHTVNGCNLNVGDIMASGTISGKSKSSYGSMLELTWGGQKPLGLKDGTQRSFIQDYDTITLKGYAEKSDFRVGFGEAVAQVLPAKK